MKTSQEWFHELPVDISDWAIDNTNPANLEEEYETLQEAIFNSFTWNDTPQGATFWQGVVDQLEGEADA